MLESVNNNRLQYQKLTEEEKQNRKILGTLVGPCCDIENPTRNGRKYSEKLWETVFASPLVKEQFAAGGIFGELEHPPYDSVNPEKIAVVMPEPPKKNAKDGLLYGYWHILDTPCGQILKTLVDYGYKPGVSTRGNGDIIQDYQGNESVDPDTYQLNALDIVLIPAVKAARLDLVEHVDNKKTLNESLKELVNNASDNDRKIMNESLAQLNISLTSDVTGEKVNTTVPVDVATDKDGNIEITKLTDDAEPEEMPVEITVADEVVEEAQDVITEEELAKEEISSNGDDNINVNDEEKTVDNAEADIITDLQESLKQNSELKQANEALQNSVSVGIAKEQQLNEELNRCKNKIAELVESQKKMVGLTARAKKLEEDGKILSESFDSTVSSLNKTIVLQRANIETLERLNRRIANQNQIKISSLNESLKNANTDLEELKQKYEEETTSQFKELESIKESFDNHISDMKSTNSKLLSENKRLKQQLTEVTEAYTKFKCRATGVDYNIIKNSITGTNSLDDIDRLTESVARRKVVENKLPFSNISVNGVKYNKPNTSYYDGHNPDDIPTPEGEDLYR